MMDNKVLVITGMHRSGTSMLAQWLHKCGLHVGDQFLGVGIGNDDGHFEDLDFYQYHKNILRDQGLPEDGLIETTISELSAGQLCELRKLISNKNAGQAQWAWKEPRTCLFLEQYRQLLPAAVYLVILRDYSSVVSSLVNRIYNGTVAKYADRKGLSKFMWEYVKKPFRKKKLLGKYGEHFLKVWITYNEAILRHLQRIPAAEYLVVDHMALAASNKTVFRHLSETWHFSLSYYEFSKVFKQKLLGEQLNITSYIHNKSLLAKADQLQKDLQQLAVK